MADNIRQRELPRFADTEPSAACAAAVRALAALSEGLPEGPVVSDRAPSEPPRLTELRGLLQQRYPDSELAALRHDVCGTEGDVWLQHPGIRPLLELMLWAEMIGWALHGVAEAASLYYPEFCLTLASLSLMFPEFTYRYV